MTGKGGEVVTREPYRKVRLDHLLPEAGRKEKKPDRVYRSAGEPA